MSEFLQRWLLANIGPIRYMVNERLAKRSGLLGRMFKYLEIGERQYGQHTLTKTMRVANYFWVKTYQIAGMMRLPAARFIGVHNGPLNYSGMALWFWMTFIVLARFRLIRARDNITFNHQDSPEFWYSRYNMMFPPSFLHNRMSAHYIEINHIFAVEMMKRYQYARKEIIAEREAASDIDKRTRYAQPNYVYEALGPDSAKMTAAKMQNDF